MAGPALRRALPGLLAALWAVGATALVFAYVKYESRWLVAAFLVWTVFPLAWLLDPEDDGDGGGG